MSIQALAMGADGSIVAGMSRGRVARWSNGRWELLREKKGAVQDLWVSPADAVWVAANACERWAGQLERQKVKLGSDGFMCVWGTADDDLWVSGYGREIAHWDGGRWDVHDTGLTNGESDYIAGLAGTREHVYAGGEYGIARWDGVAWTGIEESTNSCINGAATMSDGRAVFAAASAHPELWIVAPGGHERIELDDDALDGDEMQRIAAGPSDRLYFTTGGLLLSWLGGELRQELRCEEFDCIAVASNGVSVATATDEGVWILEDEWRLIGAPTF